MGPLTSHRASRSRPRYIKVAQDQGSQILTGGKTPSNPELAAGCYIEPTVVTAKPEDRVCQEEVFGPFVSA
jgi:aldehyde dehydrogenase (NAD+)